MVVAAALTSVLTGCLTFRDNRKMSSAPYSEGPADLRLVDWWTRTAARSSGGGTICSLIAPPADALLWSGREHQKNRAGERWKRSLSLAM
jgi:hypothetical protein